MNDPVLVGGLDIGIKRDTAALVVTYHDIEKDSYGMWGHRIWKPPVNLITQVEPVLFKFLELERVAALLFDPYQFAATNLRLESEGYYHLLQEVNQQTEMISAANSQHELCTEHRYLMYPDPEIRAHFAHAAAEVTRRGWRIVKKKQGQPIDAVVAAAMSIMGSLGDVGYATHPGFQADVHGRSVLDLP